ncbi:AfsR/SARP family transcriptional regulator [Streptomyces parvulus]|uniref:AfsR/SARP family transcriptional regulator n=1 Tax=Streptomyces parvulus TaxID=146923 RepID=UPI003440CA6A
MNPLCLTASAAAPGRSGHVRVEHSALAQVEPLRFSLLGPLRAWRGSTELSLGSPQQQAVLAALVLRGGRSATTDELIAAVWASPPAGAASVVRTYISKLRTVLGTRWGRTHRGSALRSTPGGYVLSLPAGASDAARLENDMAEARHHRDSDRSVEARGVLLRALGRWSGSPLAGVPGPLAEAERERLVELRLTLEVAVLSLDLELDGHRQAVPELFRLTAAHPLREEPRRLLMTALLRCGRRAEALAVYEETRRILASELGVAPAASLRRLRDRIMAGEPGPGLGAAKDPAGHPTTDTAQERQGSLATLPTDLPDFTGRAAETDELVAALSTCSAVATGVAVVSGMGGVGKTSLAVHAAHRLAPRFPDGQLYVDLGTRDDPLVAVDAVLTCFLQTLGGQDIVVPRDRVERAALFRTLVAGRRVLFVLDDASDAEQVRQLLPGSALCAVLVTSRARLGSLSATVRIALDAPAPDEAMEMFARMLGSPISDADALILRRLVEVTGGLPLAIRVLASRQAARPGWPVAQTFAGLRGGPHLLPALQTEGLSVADCIQVGFGRLDKDQARAFLLPARAGIRVFTTKEVMRLLDAERREVRRLMDSLVDAGMLTSVARERYAYHALFFAFARAYGRGHADYLHKACS